MKNIIYVNYDIGERHRKVLATHLSLMVDGEDIDATPYMLNDTNDYFWTVDNGNNWKIKFFPEDPRKIEIIHRYTNQEAVEGLTAFLSYILHGEVRGA